MSSRHHIVRAIFDHALAAVDPIRAIQSSISIDNSQINICRTVFDISTRPLYAIALGKAAASMANGLNLVLGERIQAGILSGPLTPSFNSANWKTFYGGHPTPNEQSLAAAQAAFTLLDQANSEHAIVIALVSGGGSAMMESPAADDISIDDLRLANQLLVNCGASINEINVVRRAFSSVKGGGLARRSGNATLITLISSDTNTGDEASVASGPTLDAPQTRFSALDVVKQYQLESVLPSSILRVITEGRSAPPIAQEFVKVLLDNETAVQAAESKAVELGFKPVIAHNICEQPIDVGCREMIAQLDTLPAGSCLISGGEFACPVRGDGVGGRNLETALRCAQLVSQSTLSNVTILSAGTDGIDGNSPAAGAVADETTIPRARTLGLDPDVFLANSDSYSFFEKLHDTINTGPTGTNVRDLRIVLK